MLQKKTVRFDFVFDEICVVATLHENKFEINESSVSKHFLTVVCRATCSAHFMIHWLVDWNVYFEKC